MSGPTLQECFAFCDTGIRLQSDSGNVVVDLAPARRPEFTESVVFRGDALQIKNEMALTFATSRVARRKRGIRIDFQQRGNAIAHPFRTKDQIARQDRSDGTE